MSPLGSWSGLSLLLILLGDACGPLPVTDVGIGDGIFVDNRTGLELHYEMIVETTVYPLMTPTEEGRALLVPLSQLGPASLIGAEGCTKGDVLALAPNGREVARRNRPYCLHDTWIIPGPSPGS